MRVRRFELSGDGVELLVLLRRPCGVRSFDATRVRMGISCHAWAQSLDAGRMRTRTFRRDRERPQSWNAIGRIRVEGGTEERRVFCSVICRCSPEPVKRHERRIRRWAFRAGRCGWRTLRLLAVGHLPQPAPSATPVPRSSARRSPRSLAGIVRGGLRFPMRNFVRTFTMEETLRPGVVDVDEGPSRDFDVPCRDHQGRCAVSHDACDTCGPTLGAAAEGSYRRVRLFVRTLRATHSVSHAAGTMAQAPRCRCMPAHGQSDARHKPLPLIILKLF